MTAFDSLLSLWRIRKPFFLGFLALRRLKVIAGGAFPKKARIFRGGVRIEGVGGPPVFLFADPSELYALGKFWGAHERLRI